MTPRPVDRVRIVPGSRLRADDLRDLVAVESARRAEHVRDVHATWGVGVGFAVAVVLDGWGVVVGPGIAYDCAGREIVLSRSVRIEIPPGEGGWVDLAVAHARDRELARGHEERPVFRWGFVDAPDAPAPLSLRVGESVPLARIAVGQSGVPSLGTRRGARSAARPRIAAASVPFAGTISGAMSWTMSVDTSAAGFSSTPVYHVTLGWDDDTSAFLLGPFLSIANATADAFDLTVRYGVSGLVWEGPAPTLPDMTVDWVGVELARGCWPRVALRGALPSLGTPVTKELDGIDA